MNSLWTNTWRLLRSRRLAAWSIIAMATYVIAATFVPQNLTGQTRIDAWANQHPAVEKVVSALGFHHAYSTPLFLLLTSLLSVSTLACATERFKRARLMAKALGCLSDQDAQRLRSQPQATIALPSTMPADLALKRAERAFRRSGFKVRRLDDALVARSHAIVVFASPFFHASLVALMLVIIAGQLTRSGGFMGLPLGERVAEEHKNYLIVSEGPLFGENHTGLEFEASSIDRNHVEHGVDFAAVPYVKVFRDETEVASGYVRPNKPLRVGSVLIHRGDFGPEAIMAVEDSYGAEVSRQSFLLDRTDETSSGSTPRTFQIRGEPVGGDMSVRMQVITQGDPREAERSRSVAIVETSTVGSSVFGPAVKVAEGDAVQLPGGGRLRLVEVKDWVRISVMNDWSVPFVYLFLFTAIVGLAVAALAPPRKVAIAVREDGQTPEVAIATWYANREPVFAERVEQLVRRAVEKTEES